MSYLLDANVFMSAKNLHYGLDFCPAFWDWLVEKGNKTMRSFCAKRSPSPCAKSQGAESIPEDVQ
mgnify:CR=1 FL=1